jgi:hypothetical protein
MRPVRLIDTSPLVVLPDPGIRLARDLAAHTSWYASGLENGVDFLSI